MMTNPTDPTPPASSRHPYADSFEAYWQAGFEGILPLPAGQKKPVPAGFTGNHGVWPSWPDVMAWAEDRPGANVALRLPEHVIGVDVDAYGDKPGGLVLAELERRLGTLPATWRSTSRDDGVSGIRLYRVPEHLAWPNIFGPGIESIRFGHRYVVAPPSLHPDTQRPYRWIDPAGNTSLAVPELDELPALPDAWVEHFTGGQLAGEGDDKATLDDGQASDWLSAHGAGEPCRVMASCLADVAGIGASRHDHFLSLTNRVLWLAGEGHLGASSVLAQARAAFMHATAGDRATGEAEREWDRMIVGGIAISVAAHHTIPEADPCLNPFDGIVPKENPWPAATADAPQPPNAPSNAPTATDAATSAASTPTAHPASPTAEPATAPASSTTAETTATASDAADVEAWRQQQRELAIAHEYERRQAREEANRRFDVEHREEILAMRVERRLFDDDVAKVYRERTEPPAPPFDMGTLSEVLARDPEPPMRMAGIVPWDASTLLIAQRKTGKTTAMLNWARCLLKGEPFLGRFDTIALEEHEKVAVLNFEVSGAQLGRWAHEAGIDPERLVLVNLRGRRNPLSHDGDRETLAGVLREQQVGALVVDPFGRAFTGDNQNDNGQVQNFLVDLDLFTRAEVGARDLMLAAHAGWGAERARGASALEDWADTIITMTRDEKDESRRFLKAEGRDVDIEEDELSFDELTRTLSLTGNGPRKKTSKREKDVSKIAVLLRRAAAQEPGCSLNRAADLARSFPDCDVTVSTSGSAKAKFDDALKLALEGGFVEVRAGSNGQPHTIRPATPEHQGATYNLTASTTSNTTSGNGGSGNHYHFPPSLEGEVRSASGAVRDEATGVLVNRYTGEAV